MFVTKNGEQGKDFNDLMTLVRSADAHSALDIKQFIALQEQFTILTEGKNRQVRRMIEAIGARVMKLVRIRIGDIAIGDLPIGKWRLLTRQELTRLRR